MDMKKTKNIVIFLRLTTYFLYYNPQWVLKRKPTGTHTFYSALTIFSASFPAFVIRDFSKKEITNRKTCQEQASNNYFWITTKKKQV